MKTMNVIRTAVLIGILGAAPASAGISTSPGTRDAYPIRKQMAYDESGTRDAYPIRKEMAYGERGSLRRWLDSHSTLFARLIASIR